MKKFTGWIIVGTLISYLISVFVSPAILVLPTLFAWAILLLRWSDITKGVRNQASILLILGLLALLFSLSKGVFLGFLIRKPPPMRNL